MDYYEYWIGKDIDYENLWGIYAGGDEYIIEFNRTKSAYLKLSFEKPRVDEPLFIYEALYKSIKGTYHDFKHDVYPELYESAKPLYLYSIDRGSFDISFLLDPQLIGPFVYVIVEGVKFFLNRNISGDLPSDDRVEELKSNKDFAVGDFIEKMGEKINMEMLDKHNFKRITMKEDSSGDQEVVIEFQTLTEDKDTPTDKD